MNTFVMIKNKFPITYKYPYFYQLPLHVTSQVRRNDAVYIQYSVTSQKKRGKGSQNSNKKNISL